MYDGGQAYNGGGAFNNTMAGISFDVVTYGGSLTQTAVHFGFNVSEDGVAAQATEPSTVVEAIIVTGKRLASEFEFARALASRTPDITDDLVFSLGAIAFGNYPQKYIVLDQVGDTACDADEAWEGLLLNAAPGATGPVTNGQISNLPGFGPVQHIVDPVQMSVTNVAQPGHVLYPGTVTREVVVQGGKVYIQTTGTGTGQFSGINVLASKALWATTDSAIAQYVDANDNGPGDC